MTLVAELPEEPRHIMADYFLEAIIRSSFINEMSVGDAKKLAYLVGDEVLVAIQHTMHIYGNQTPNDSIQWGINYRKQLLKQFGIYE